MEVMMAGKWGQNSVLPIGTVDMKIYQTLKPRTQLTKASNQFHGLHHSTLSLPDYTASYPIATVVKILKSETEISFYMRDTEITSQNIRIEVRSIPSPFETLSPPRL